MSSRGPLHLSELDRLIGSIGLPVRSESLAEAWEGMPAPDPTPLPVGQVLVMVTMRARPGQGQRLAEAAREFVQATSNLTGALGSTLHRSDIDPEKWFLIERFETEAAFAQHMASEYFGRFQIEQHALLAHPVEAIFLQTGTR
jgi:quinol monooxygenase YgiN